MSDNFLIFVDGNNFLLRAYHGISNSGLSNSKGQPTGAIRIYINMLKKLMHDYPGSTISVVFDAHGGCFRKELYPEYKANRKPLDEDLRVQIPYVMDIIKNLGIKIFEVPGVEADDVLATYALKAKEEGYTPIIATSDKDLCALIDDGITILDTMKKKVIDAEEIKKKFGVPPKHLRDYLALCGDTADNVPGMSGVGEKTAAILLNEIGDIDEIKNNLDKIAELKFRGSKNFKEKFLKEEEVIFLCRKLVTLKTDVELPVSVAQLSMEEPNHQRLWEIYQELEFSSLADSEKKFIENPSLTTVSTKNDNVDNENIDNENLKEDTQEIKNEVKTSITSEPYNKIDIYDDVQSIKELCNKILLEGICFIELFTSKDHYLHTKIEGILIGCNSNCAIIPCTNDVIIDSDDSGEEKLNLLKDIFTQGVRVIAYDIKRLMHVLWRYKIKLNMPYDDISIMAHTYDSSDKLNLESLAQKYLKQNIEKEEDFFGKGAKSKTFKDVSLELLSKYGLCYLNIIKSLYFYYQNELKDANLSSYQNEELPLISVICQMEESGVKVNPAILQKQGIVLHKKVEDLKSKLFLLAGEEFNPNSPLQISRILYEKLNLPCVIKTSKGAPSTSEEALSELALTYELPRLLLEYREINKLLNTYVDKLSTQLDCETNRLHASFNQCGTVTGRLSSSDPNLQNIPIRTENGRLIRDAFDARDGYKIVAADYSQIELRIMAHMANETHMIEAFYEKKDIHQITASQMYKVPLEEVTPDLRRQAKAINFGLIYGMTAFGLAKQIGISRSLAKEYMDIYFNQYPMVKDYMSSTLEFANKEGFVKTFNGKVLDFKELKTASRALKASLERAAINAPIQGSAAQIIKLAMIKIYEWLKDKQDEAILLMQVHDELVFEIREDKVDEFVEKIHTIMTTVVNLRVPLEVEVGVGKNWNEAH